MKEATARRLYRAAKRLGYTEDDGDGARVRLYKDYSGRGMYGRTTWGLTVRSWSLVVACAAVARPTKKEHEEGTFDRERFAEEVAGLGSDSMGRDSIIVY